MEGNAQAPKGNPKRKKQGKPKKKETEQKVVETPEVKKEAEPVEKEAPLVRSRGEEVEECPICVEPIDFWILGSCNHRKICFLCSLRRRVLYKQLECPLCRQLSEHVVMTRDATKPYQEFEIESMPKDEEFKIYFDKEAGTHFEKLSRLWQFLCPYCDVGRLDSIQHLKQHVKDQHSLFFCNVCLQDRKVFLQEQKLYSQKDLKAHNTNGDKDTMVKHERCDFCTQYFYDKDKLYEHLNSAHETCFLCERNGIHYQYYKHYSELEKHFRSEHYFCEEPECIQQKFVVFNSETELQLHEVEKHLASRGGSRSQKKNVAALKLDISVRSGVTSTIVPKDEEDEAEEKKALDVSAPEQFPTLDGQHQTSSAPATTWGRVPSQNPVNEFPSLPSQREARAVQPQPWGASQAPSRGGASQTPSRTSRVPSHPSQSRLSEISSRLQDPFPMLNGSSSTRAPSNFVPLNLSWGRPSSQAPSQPWPNPAPALTQGGDNFPSLPGSSKPQSKGLRQVTTVWSNSSKRSNKQGKSKYY